MIILLLITLSLIRIYSYHLIYKNNKNGFFLYIILSGLSIKSFECNRIEYFEIGSICSIEWIIELIIILFYILLSFLKKNSNYDYSKLTGIPLFYILIFSVLLFRTETIDLYSSSTLLNAVFPALIILFLLQNISLLQSINSEEIKKIIFFTVLISIIWGTFASLVYEKPFLYYINDRVRFGASMHPAPYALFLLPFLIFLLVHKHYKHFLILFLLLLLTVSRMAIFTIILLFIVDKIKSKRTFVQVMVVFVILSSAVFYYWDIVEEYFINYSSGRFKLWQITIEKSFVNYYNYIFGNGTGHAKNIIWNVFPAQIGYVDSIHNEYFRLSVDIGLIFTILLLIIYPFSYVLQNYKKNGDLSIKYIIYTLICIMILSVTDNVLYYMFVSKNFIFFHFYQNRIIVK